MVPYYMYLTGKCKYSFIIQPITTCHTGHLEVHNIFYDKSVIHCRSFDIAKKYLNSNHFPSVNFLFVRHFRDRESLPLVYVKILMSYENFAELKYLNQMKFKIGHVVN